MPTKLPSRKLRNCNVCGCVTRNPCRKAFAVRNCDLMQENAAVLVKESPVPIINKGDDQLLVYAMGDGNFALFNEATLQQALATGKTVGEIVLTKQDKLHLVPDEEPPIPTPEMLDAIGCPLCRYPESQKCHSVDDVDTCPNMIENLRMAKRHGYTLDEGTYIRVTTVDGEWMMEPFTRERLEELLRQYP